MAKDRIMQDVLQDTGAVAHSDESITRNDDGSWTLRSENGWDRTGGNTATRMEQAVLDNGYTYLVDQRGNRYPTSRAEDAKIKSLVAVAETMVNRQTYLTNKMEEDIYDLIQAGHGGVPREKVSHGKQ